eukprot:scaffold31995_cov66-Skeletonema_marinoi.AAC.1
MKHRYGKDPVFYPLRALSYALSHRELFWTVLKVACVGITVSIIILVILLVTALQPQAQAISPNLEWWAWLIAVFLVLIAIKSTDKSLYGYNENRGGLERGYD